MKKDRTQYYKEYYKTKGYKYHKQRYLEIKQDAVAFEILRDCQKGNEYKYSQSAKGLYRLYKNSAIRYNRPFTLTIEDMVELIENKTCKCGNIPTRLVRIINSDGYTMENVVQCCPTCKPEK